jgi:hypothetical protein
MWRVRRINMKREWSTTWLAGMPKRANVDPSDQAHFTDMGDPANAEYLFPLENEEDEETAWDMADVNYHVYAESFSDDITQEECDYVFEQCLVDCRRMICDPDYGRMFGLIPEDELRRAIERLAGKDGKAK